MKRPARSLLASLALVAAGCPAAVVDDGPPDGAGPALLFEPLPDAFRLPDDDLDPGADGLQVDVELRLENVTDAIASVTVVSAGGFSVDAPFDGDRAVARVVLDVDVFPGGADNIVVASAGDLDARRSIIGLDLREPPPPVPPRCELSVDTVGVAVVTCAAAPDEADAAVSALAAGGLVALTTTNDAGVARVRSAELHGGNVAFSFAFDVDGTYDYVARLVGAEALTGSAVTATTTATVDLP